MEERNIVNYYELKPEWQEEAISNLGMYAEEMFYLKPKELSKPATHILWDLSETMPCEGIHEGFIYNASIAISNNSAMLLNIDDQFETAKIMFV